MHKSNPREPFTASFAHLSDQPFKKEFKYPLRQPPIKFHEENVYHLEKVLQYIHQSRNIYIDSFGFGTLLQVYELSILLTLTFLCDQSLYDIRYKTTSKAYTGYHDNGVKPRW